MLTILMALGFMFAPPTSRVGVLLWSPTIPGQLAMRRGLEAEAARLSARQNARPFRLEVEVAGDGDQGIERQIKQMHDMVARRVDVIVVQPTDNAALAKPLKAANAAGIPVIAFDQYISEGNLAAYVTSDNRQAGELTGEVIASRFPDAFEIKLVVVEYPAVSSTVERLDGFLAALGNAKQHFRIVGAYEAVEPVAGAQAGRDILAAFPQKGSVDVVFTVNDGGGLAIVNALASAGRTEILVATVDGDPASVHNIQSGRLTVIDAAQFCGRMGQEAMRLTIDVLEGRPVPAQTLVPTFPITRQTLARYPGWEGPLPAAFTKPWPSQEPLWQPSLKTFPAKGLR